MLLLTLSIILFYLAFLKAIERPLLERQLTVDDLQKSLEERDITRFVKIIGKDWYHFGTGMNIEHHKLDEIKADRSNQAERIIVMLNYLINQENAKYESILYALYEMDNQNPNLIKVLDYLARKLGKKTHSEGILYVCVCIVCVFVDGYIVHCCSFYVIQYSLPNNSTYSVLIDKCM